MNTINFFYPSMIKLIINLDDTHNSISSCMKECNMLWSQVKKSFELLYMYNFVDIEKTRGSRYYNLTVDGMKLRDMLCNVNSLINKNVMVCHTQIYGYKSKEELIEDVQKDLEYFEKSLLSDKSSISATTTSE